MMNAVHFSLCPCRVSGGAGRDRTDDLKLAKLPLSQLSYGPFRDATKNLKTGQDRPEKHGGPG